MIYVILGVIILVVSFVIALFSLIRESNKEREEVSEDSSIVSNVEPDLKNHKTVEVKSVVELASEGDLIKQDNKFPWEKALENDNNLTSASGTTIAPRRDLEEKVDNDIQASNETSVGVISVQELAKKQNSQN